MFKDVRLRALQDTPSAFSSTYAKESRLTDAEWVARAAQWYGAGSIAYLASKGETAVGIVAGLVDPNDSSVADLRSMWVAPTHRRLGIGRTLVEAIVNWAHAQGATTLRLLVTSNNDRATKFYQRLGFSHTGQSKPYANDQALRDLEMVRPLSP